MKSGADFGFCRCGHYSLDDLAQGVDGSVVGWEGDWLVAIFNKLAGEGGIAFGSAACVFVVEMGCIADGV